MSEPCRMPAISIIPMSNFILLTPFGRAQNADALKSNVAAATEGFTGTVRHIAITDDIAYTALFSTSLLLIKKPNWWPSHTLLNSALDMLLPMPDHLNWYFCFMDDDDALEPGWFNTLSAALSDNGNPECLVVNMKRWYNGPTVNDELVSAPANMAVGQVGLEQIIVRADVMAHYRLANWPGGDGEMIAKMFKERPDGFKFDTSIFTNWNKLPNTPIA